MSFSLFRKKKDNAELTLPADVNQTQEDKQNIIPYTANNISEREIAPVNLDEQKLNAQKEVAMSSIAMAETTINMVGGTINNAIDVYRTSLIVEQNIESIKARTQIELANIASKYQLCQAAMIGIFGERNNALQKHYQVLDNAIQNDDRELIIQSLRSISSIVVTNPLDEFTSFMDSWNTANKKAPLELDF